MIDHSYPDYTKIFRHAEIRVHGLSINPFDFDKQLSRSVSGEKAWLYWVKKGRAWLITKQDKKRPQLIEQGTIVGVEGVSHEWKSVASLDHEKQPTEGADTRTEIFASSIDKRSAILQRLPSGVIAIPPETHEYSNHIQSLASMMERHHASHNVDDGVCRKLAEIILILLINYARELTIRDDLLGEQYTHDEYILRAMSSFFMAPQKKWTVSLLADEAGLSRAALFERFNRAFGDSPMKILNQIRLQLASEMLINTRASMTEISHAVGYGSAPAFVRSFSKFFGITPGQWRSKNSN